MVPSASVKRLADHLKKSNDNLQRSDDDSGRSDEHESTKPRSAQWLGSVISGLFFSD